VNKNRLEAFSDGVIAIILTIMVLELKVPQEATWEAFQHLGPHLLSYVISFTIVAIYWNNHHHMLHGVKHVNGRVLWMNMLLLFFLSLFPFCTAWVGQTHFAALPVSFYGAVLLAAALSYGALFGCLLELEGPNSVLARAVSATATRKSQLSQILYLSGTVLAWWAPRVAFSFYILVALMWLIPDKRIEELLTEEDGGKPVKRAR
jgi:uncharacterized membrane protein